MHLPNTLYYCQGQIAIRFLRAPIKNESLLITIPGGGSKWKISRSFSI